MIATSSAVSRRVSRLVRRSSRARPVNSTKLIEIPSRGRGRRDRRERQALVRTDQEADLVGAGWAALALRQPADELALAETDVVQLAGDRGRERLYGGRPRGPKVGREPLDLALGSDHRFGCDLCR